MFNKPYKEHIKSLQKDNESLREMVDMCDYAIKHPYWNSKVHRPGELPEDLWTVIHTTKRPHQIKRVNDALYDLQEDNRTLESRLDSIKRSIGCRCATIC